MDPGEKIPQSFEEAGEWLLGLELFGMDFGTDRMRRLLSVVGDPQDSFRAIHVVGSNGKSSTTRLAEAILRAQGVSTGAYLSPHLGSWTERVLIDGGQAGESDFAAAAADVARAVRQVDGTGEAGPVTQFEAMTAIAFLLFARVGVEAAVVEAGLGGRLDATNVIDAPVCVLVSVGLEHTRWLGETVSAIAAEKLDVVSPASTLVVPADLNPGALDVAVARADEVGARIVVAPASSPLAPPGTAPYLSHNLALAAAAAHAFLGALDDSLVRQAVGSGALDIRGRYEIAGGEPRTILDGAHNADGAAALARALEEEDPGRPVVACLSILDDKDADAMIGALAGVVDRFVFTRSSHPRSISPSRLVEIAGEAGGRPAGTVEEPHAALESARAAAGPSGTVVAAGSLYLIADLGRPVGARGASTL